ncbi:MAG: PriCT-2 domain-containing protein [Methylomicrobium sp.]
MSSSDREAFPKNNPNRLFLEVSFASNPQAALHWFDFGFDVIPILPGSKQPALKWDPWLADLSSEKIAQHWASHPDHEVGFIVGPDYIVFGADSPEAVATIARIERMYYLAPRLVVNTKKGEHHIFRRAQGTYATSDAHDTQQYPDRIDVKTGRALVILPSTDKVIRTYAAASANKLTVAEQDVIDAVSKHNGRPAPRPPQIPSSPRTPSEPQSRIIPRLKALLDCLDPDGGYDDWLKILMAVFYETGGSEAGFELALDWSRKGRKFKDEREIRAKWNSFKNRPENPITIRTLIKMLEDKGIDWIDVCSRAEDPFEPCETIVIQNPRDLPAESPVSLNPLDKYSLNGQAAEIEKNTVEDRHVLGSVALQGQATAIFAAPNTGKTLITFRLLIEAIKNSRLSPGQVYYLNMDDTSKGLLEKLRIAEEYGFHVLAEGYREFTAREFLNIVASLVKNDQAKGVVIILDTLKKFVNVMDKSQVTNLTRIIRLFVVKGGTLISLAHTNKNPGANGKPVYGGTSDILDDYDCAYTLAAVSHELGQKVVVFENIKRRGNVVETAAYRYSTDPGLSYNEMLLSVEPFDEAQVEPLKQAEVIKSDAVLIDAVITCINAGINTKMLLAEAVAERAGISKRKALQIIEKYTGDSPSEHRWTFTVGARGAKVYVLLAPASPEQPT